MFVVWINASFFFRVSSPFSFEPNQNSWTLGVWTSTQTLTSRKKNGPRFQCCNAWVIVQPTQPGADDLVGCHQSFFDTKKRERNEKFSILTRPDIELEVSLWHFHQKMFAPPPSTSATASEGLQLQKFFLLWKLRGVNTCAQNFKPLPLKVSHMERLLPDNSNPPVH